MEGPHRNTLKLEEKIRSLIDEIFDQHPAPDALLILIGLFTFSMATHLPPERAFDWPESEKPIPTSLETAPQRAACQGATAFSRGRVTGAQRP
jgi:hypothetical protein